MAKTPKMGQGLKVAVAAAKKKAQTYKGKSMAPGGGGQFAKMTDAVKSSMMKRHLEMSEEEAEKRAKAVAAAKGRQTYGKKKFQQMAAKGKKRAAAKRKKGK